MLKQDCVLPLFRSLNCDLVAVRVQTARHNGVKPVFMKTKNDRMVIFYNKQLNPHISKSRFSNKCLKLHGVSFDFLTKRPKKKKKPKKVVTVRREFGW